jgi:hypothetical protein
MKTPCFSLCAAIGLALMGVATPEPAVAQGTSGIIPVGPQDRCPKEYVRGEPGNSKRPNAGMCYPSGSNPPLVYVRKGNAECASGYYKDQNPEFCTTKYTEWTTFEQRRSKATKLARASATTRCPTGWSASANATECYTQMDNPPSARLKNGKSCAPGELDEWDTWCTSGYETMGRKVADSHAVQDFNEVYLVMMNSGKDISGMKCCMSPAAQAYFESQGEWAVERVNGDEWYVDRNGVKLGLVANGPISPERARQIAANPKLAGNAQGSASSSGQASPCSAGGSQTGAAIGGALAGEGGAVLGSLLGGLGKKKKKGGC